MSYLENLNNIPDEMKKLNCWCCFDVVKESDGKTVKRIYNPNSIPRGRFIPYAKANDSSTWASFDKAVSFCKKNNLKGLSFALSKENGIHCVDLDHCKSAGGDFSGTGAAGSGFKLFRKLATAGFEILCVNTRKLLFP